MAGKSIILKPGQILFSEGDKSDGMYLVRKGELAVFLHKDQKQVVLAKVGPGGMIGEMALFDKKPRSASVKAVDQSEVTVVTNQDFAKLMKQIPKWFVGLMGTLSGRLRSTNERLQKLEGLSKTKPFEKTLLVLSIINLFWHKDGVKQGKEWHLDKKSAAEPIQNMLGEESDIVEPIFASLIQAGVFSTKKNSYNGIVLVMKNKGILEQFLKFFKEFVKTSGLPGLSDAGYEVLSVVKILGKKSAYDTYTNSLKELMLEGKKEGMQTVPDWDQAIQEFASSKEGITVVKTSDGTLGIKAERKEVEKIVKYHTWIRALAKKGLP